MMENLDFSIVLPAYNESENLPDVLKDLKKALSKADIKSEIIVVDNGSDDDTQGVLELLKMEITELKTLRIEKNIGWGDGVIRGLEIARGPILGYMVADGQATSEDLINVYQKLRSNSLDLCKGTRISRCDGLTRATIGKIYNFLFRLMFRCPFRDVNAGPKVFTRNLYEAVNLKSKDGFIDPEILIKAKDNNFSVGEVPVVSLVRKKGSSSVSVATAFEFIKNMLHWFLFKKP